MQGRKQGGVSLRRDSLRRAVGCRDLVRADGGGDREALGRCDRAVGGLNVLGDAAVGAELRPKGGTELWQRRLGGVGGRGEVWRGGWAQTSAAAIAAEAGLAECSEQDSIAGCLGAGEGGGQVGSGERGGERGGEQVTLRPGRHQATEAGRLAQADGAPLGPGVDELSW